MELSDWNDLRFVLAAWRAGTVTEAARVLRVDQTTVSRRLRSLQDRLEIPLFEQLRGGVVLTPAGAELVAAAEEVERRVHDLERRALGQEEALRGTLRVTLPAILAAAWVDVFADFTTRYPNIALTIVADDRILNVTRREADIALRYTEAPPEHLVGRRVARLALAAYAAAGVEKPAQLPWIGWDDGTAVHRTLEAWRARNDDAGTEVFRVDHFQVAYEALRRGHGRCILPCAFGDTRPELKRIGAPDPAFMASFWALTHPDLRRVPRVRALMTHLTDWLTAHRPLLEGEQPYDVAANQA